MNRMCLVFAFLAVFAAQAQPTNTLPRPKPVPAIVPVQPAKKLQPTPGQLAPSQAQTASAQPSRVEPILLFEAGDQTSATNSILSGPRPNEIISGKLTYSGIAVEAVKRRNLLQLLNPLAPPQYGSPEDNVARDVITHKVVGLKLFAIQF